MPDRLFAQEVAMGIIQLDFFKSEEQCEIESLKRRIEEVKCSNDKVRKKLFADNGKLVKEVAELKARLDILEQGLCRMKSQS